MFAQIYQAACFDLDGTLIDTEPLHLKAECQTLHHFGKERMAYGHPRTFGMGIAPGMALLATSYDLHDHQQVLRIYTSFWNRLLDTELELMPGVRRLLKVFRDAPIPIALVTSSDTAYADIVISKFSLDEAFRCVITCDQTPHLKPSPEPYCLAARGLGVPPQKVVAFEDSGSGVTSAISAGMYCVAVHKEVASRPELRAAQLRIASLESFKSTDLANLFGMQSEPRDR